MIKIDISHLLFHLRGTDKPGRKNRKLGRGAQKIVNRAICVPPSCVSCCRTFLKVALSRNYGTRSERLHPSIIHTVQALSRFVVVQYWTFYPYPSGLLHWHRGNHTIRDSFCSWNRTILGRICVDYAGWTCPCPPPGRLSNTCINSLSVNDTKCLQMGLGDGCLAVLLSGFAISWYKTRWKDSRTSMTRPYCI